jgi:hypothetical protein
MSLHTITLNGESLLLFLAPVDWAEGVAITHRLDAEVEEGLTGLESRRPRYGALRLEMTFTALVTGTDVGALRDGLRSTARLRVAVPLWPDLLEAGAAAAGIYTAPNVLQWNMDTGAYAVNKTAAIHPLRAPLVIGRLSDEPEMEVLGGGLVSVTMKVVEDSPYAERIGLNAVDVGDDWPTDLMPDWKKNAAGIQHRTEASQVGEGRVRHVEGVESLVRLTQQANFVLPDVTHIRRLLSFYRARRGRAESFVMPFCLQDGTTAIHHGRFRFAKDGLKVTFKAPGVAEASVSFVEAPEGVRDVHPAVFALPAVECLLADVRFLADVRDRFAAFGLSQDSHDFRYAVSSPFHGLCLSFGPATLTFQVVRFDAVRPSILTDFKTAHQSSQSRDTQKAVKMTKDT